jgi:UDP-glucose:(heptosyl)LPS alpha-1,3-glucosyltransferase
MYYGLIRALERRIYPKSSIVVGVVSQKVAEELRRLFKRNNQIRVIYQGIDFEVFNPEARLRGRQEMRRKFDLAGREFVLLLIGNGWKNKGLHCVLEAMARLKELSLKLMVVGRDDRVPFEEAIKRLGLKDRVCFLLPSPDVMQFYAAADLYVGPSLQDSFALPPSEAMACGLPVITSVANGGAEIMTDGMDGLILQDPRDAEELARLIQCVVQDRELRLRLGRNALATARRYSWEQSTKEMRHLFQDAIGRKAGP